MVPETMITGVEMAKHAFFRGEFVPIEQANVSIRNHTFNYGTGCFGGLRAYWNPSEEFLQQTGVLLNGMSLGPNRYLLQDILSINPTMVSLEDPG